MSTRAQDGSERIDLVEDYFDANAQSWSDLYSRAERVNDLVLRDRKNIAVDHLARRLKAGDRILDAGCGAGLASLDMIQGGFIVHGVDISQKMLDLCKQTFDEKELDPNTYELSQTDVVQGGFDAESFDGISALGFLQYQDDEAHTLRELNRILRPGGVLVVSGPTRLRIANYFGLAGKIQRLRGRENTLPKGHEVLTQISDHYYTVGRLKNLLHGADFEVLDSIGHGYVNFAFIGGKIGFRGELMLHRGLTGLSRALPFLRSWANDVMVVARKR
jgi:2-polyprenyl-3-methyl-5-hydroxy-6-metoxy-1,4-benzoquinol methylase